MNTPLVCIALLALLVFVLGFYVSIARARGEVLYGGEDDPESALYKANRAHGNTIEYVPVLAILIYILGQAIQPAWVLWCMIVVTAARYLIVAGILLPATMAKPNPMRFLGALGTYLGGVALVVALLMQAMGGAA